MGDIIYIDNSNSALAYNFETLLKYLGILAMIFTIRLTFKSTLEFFLTDDKSFISGLTENSDHRFEMSKNDFLEFLLVLEQTVRFL